MVVPDIELVVKASGKHHADEVGHEQWQDKQLAAEGNRNPSQLGIRTEQLLPVLEAIIQGGQVACLSSWRSLTWGAGVILAMMTITTNFYRPRWFPVC